MEVGRDEDEELQQDRMALDDRNAGDEDTDDGEEGYSINIICILSCVYMYDVLCMYVQLLYLCYYRFDETGCLLSPLLLVTE